MTAVLDAQSLLSVCVAVGIGLLIGAERERRKGSGPNRSPAGIRTFAVVSFAGAVAMLLGDVLLIAVVTLLIGAFTLLAYRRAPTDDPGITTEIALILTCLIGGLAARQPLFAAALGVALAGLLAARDRIHHFVRGVLSEHELHDALLFAAVVLIALPLAPDRFVGPFGAINPRTPDRNCRVGDADQRNGVRCPAAAWAAFWPACCGIGGGIHIQFGDDSRHGTPHS
ncbi:MAG: MgtC/SapB family protein [Burkholderiales bacterium]